VRIIELPALRATHPLAYLAALGLHRALVRELRIDAQLAWTPSATPSAVVHTVVHRDDMLSSLARLWGQQAEQRAVKVLADDLVLPPRAPLAVTADREGERGMNDPAKMLPEQEYAVYARAATSAGDHEAAAWLRAVATDLVVDRTRRPPIAPLTQFYLLSRQQTLAQQFDALWAWAEKNDVRAALDEALTSWRRIELGGRLGEPSGAAMNWDIDANKNAAETPTGESSMAVVPGATWLAMMSLPYFPVRRSSAKAATRAFQTLRGPRRRPQTVLVLPTWRPRLDVPAIETLLDHPLLELADDPQQLRASWSHLDALGVSMVHTVEIVGRRVANQTEHYLGKALVAAPASGRGSTHPTRASI